MYVTYENTMALAVMCVYIVAQSTMHFDNYTSINGERKRIECVCEREKAIVEKQHHKFKQKQKKL